MNASAELPIAQKFDWVRVTRQDGGNRYRRLVASVSLTQKTFEIYSRFHTDEQRPPYVEQLFEDVPGISDIIVHDHDLVLLVGQNVKWTDEFRETIIESLVNSFRQQSLSLAA